MQTGIESEKMNPEVKKLWVEALRSGEYTQGQSVLHNTETNEYCCLGVLCELAQKAGAITEYKHDSPLPALEVCTWAGLFSDDNPSVVVTDDYGEKCEDGVAAHNDHGKTFLEIAQAIEEQL